MSTSARNEHKPDQELNIGGNVCINIEHNDSHTAVDNLPKLPEEASMDLGNRRVHEASAHLIKTTLDSLPVHPNYISNVKGRMEVHRVSDDCADVKIVHSFRAHFGAQQVSAGTQFVNTEGDAQLLDVTEVPKTQEEVATGSLDIVPTRQPRAWDWWEERDPTGCDIVPRAHEGLVPTRLPSNPWALDPRQITVGRRIAVGGFAEVFVGKYEGTVVAIKRLIDGDVSAISKFESEVAMLARLRHPNLILFMGYCMSPQLCIVSEFMQKGCLHSILRQRQGVVLDRKIQRLVALSVARGMAYLHSRQPPILHLDLKSPNILVDKNWRVKITDFGLSQMRFRTLVSHAGLGAGSPHWMAPESLRSEHVDERADVYSFGVVLWELITGKMPWENLNPMQVVGAVGFRGRSLLVPEEGDPVLIDLFKACCQGNPKDRPSFPDILDILGMQSSLGEGKKAVNQALLMDTKGKCFWEDACVDVGGIVSGSNDSKPHRMLQTAAPPLLYRTEVKASTTHPSGKYAANMGLGSAVTDKQQHTQGAAVDGCNQGRTSDKVDSPPPARVQQSPFAMLALEPFESEAPRAESGSELGTAGLPQGRPQEGCGPEMPLNAATLPPPPAPSANVAISPFAEMAAIPFGDGGNEQQSSRDCKKPEMGAGFHPASVAPSPFTALSTVPFQSWGDAADVKDSPPFPSTASEIAFKPVESQTNAIRPLSISPFAGFATVSMACDENSPSTLETGSPGIEQAVSGEWKIKVAEVELDGDGDEPGGVSSVPLQNDTMAPVGRWGSGSVDESICRDSFGMDDAGPSKIGKGGSISPGDLPMRCETDEGACAITPSQEKGGFSIPPIVFTQDPSKAVLAGVFSGGSSSVSRKPRGFLMSKFAGGSQDPHHSVSYPGGTGNFFGQLSDSESESE